MRREHYVYAHRRASDGQLFYIGKGRRRRAWHGSGRNRHWRFIAEKHGFEVEIVKANLPEQCALTLEQILIAKIGIANLANATLGGGGAVGWRHSEDAKRRIGAAFKGRKLTEKQRAALRIGDGKRLSAEHRLKLSLAKLGKRGRKMSPETRAKISASHMGLRPSAETLEKLRLSHLGKCGRLSPSYDHTIRRFVHAEHGEFVGTRGDLMAKYGIWSGDMSRLLKGERKSTKGWRLLP